MENNRYWVIDSHGYEIAIDGQEAEYAGLVDEEAGGIVAYGPWDNLVALAQQLNRGGRDQ